jgi:uncharacterized membrane protein YeaQ/YmgE (transglycosylase-associated protein family)
MFFVAWMVLGLAAGGTLSWFVYRGDRAHAADMVLGAFGASVGGFVFNVLTMRQASHLQMWSLVAALAGALVMLGGFHRLRRIGHG